MVYLKSFFFNSLFYVGTSILVIVMGPVLLFPSGYARALARFWGYMTYLLLGMIGITQNVSGDRQLNRQVLYCGKTSISLGDDYSLLVVSGASLCVETRIVVVAHYWLVFFENWLYPD